MTSQVVQSALYACLGVEGLMSKTIASLVSCKSFFISLPSPAKHECEITNFCLVWGPRTTTANFSYFHFNVIAYLT